MKTRQATPNHRSNVILKKMRQRDQSYANAEGQ